MTKEQQEYINNTCVPCEWQSKCQTHAQMQKEQKLSATTKHEYFGTEHITLDTVCIKRKELFGDDLEKKLSKVGRFDEKTPPLFE
jgi:hypothetical protein